MATAPLLEVVENDAALTDIATIVAATPAIVLVDRDKRVSLYAHIEREIEAFVPDLTTVKGRYAIKSLAFKVTRTKTAIDAAGKLLNEEARAKINLIDEARRDARNTLDILAERARKPLTEWETVETARVAECRAIIDEMRAAKVIHEYDSAATVRDRGSSVFLTALGPDRFGDMLGEAEAAKADAVNTLKRALARLTQEEADRAELARLRAEREESDRLAAEKAAAEEAERQRAEAEKRAEEDRTAREKAEAERVQRERDEAAQAARDEAERQHAVELAAERQRADEAEMARQAEADRVALEQAARDAEAKRLADEQAARDKDKAHRSAVMKAAKEAIMTCGVDEDAAKKVVLLIRSGEVPNVSLRF